jgi:hypothetical protein
MGASNVKMPTPEAKIHKKLDLFSQDKLVKSWTGSYLVNTLFYYYLFNKYKNNCFISSFTLDSGMFIDIDETEDIILGDYAWQLFTCIKKKSNVIVIPLSLKLGGSGHANLLIYRKKSNTIEHFEPHGSHFNGNENVISRKINSKLDFIIEKLNERGLNIKLVRSDVVCPRIRGLQGIEQMSHIIKLDKEGGGYCAVWSMFFTELVLKNPTIPSAELMQIIFDKIDSKTVPTDYLRKIVIGYVNIIHDKIEKYYSFITGIKKITVDEIIEINKINDMTKDAFIRDYRIIRDIQMFILNDPSSTKKSYLKELKAIKPANPQTERTIYFLENMDTLLNPSITKSEQTKSRDIPAKKVSPPPPETPLPAKKVSHPPPGTPLPAKKVSPPPETPLPVTSPSEKKVTIVNTQRYPNGTRRNEPDKKGKGMLHKLMKMTRMTKRK